MPHPAIDSADFKSLDTLISGLEEMLNAAPKDKGTLEMIVMRPDHDERIIPESFEVSANEGVPGDHWKRGTGYTLDDGMGDPDAQICIMMSGCIRAIAGDKANWPPAGDNFFIDMDLTPSNMPPGTAFSIGSAEFVVTELPHNGCQSFIDRYGRDACLFANTGVGKVHRLRGIYARVTRDGTVSVGDTVRKLSS
ncbi:MOSC domain-containing protein (plasmid) [Sulfitobacter sp. SK012]|uniref:MOSC domain-containing protein n=1 Tax=Sulfitobacter sp. SK012 TaxID=1389005 RepID=UPI000E0BE756|nr:MOSC domain-containing protein [Sulfitobacter sp. SK012]AXI49072.1 MOSC domain-containing protein [Sulfitobacter sp. SK012]